MRLYLLQLKKWHTAENDQELINVFEHEINTLYIFIINFSSPLTFHRTIYRGAFYRGTARVAGLVLWVLFP